MDDCIPLRPPFRPVQQSMQSSRDRLKDSPMDFSYDTPQRENVLQSSSSSWLVVDEDKKRPREAVDRTEVFSFGAKSPTMGTSGAFLFHQPLAPTIAGPDVEMSSDTTPVKAASIETATSLPEQVQEDGPSRRLASSGALTRVSRNRGAGGKRGLEQKTSQSASQTRSKGRRKAKAVREGEWEDDEVKEEEARSLWNGAGGTTTNIQYVFGGGNSAQQHPGGPRHSGTLDPEWCLGMAQFAFNVMLLFGVLWLIWGVVQTLQRDVADKVREYELEFLSEIEACSHSYHLNKCGTEGAVPALASACASWQKCSAKDPAIVGRSRVAAETVAEIVNGFVDVVSWKSMLFTLLSLVVVVGATNSTLSFFRLRSRRAQTHTDNLSHQHPIMPPYDPNSTHHAPYGYHPYNSAAHWHASPPSTPSTKRMCT